MSRPYPAKSTTSSSLKGKTSTDDISLKDIMYLLYSLRPFILKFRQLNGYLFYILLFLYVAAEDQNDIFITTQRQ